MATPIQFKTEPRHRQGDQFSYSAQFVEDESPMDLTVFDDIVVKLYAGNTTVFEQSTDAGTINISSSAGSNNDILSGVVSDEKMDVAVRSYYLDIQMFIDGQRTTYTSDKFKIVGPGESGTSSEWLITITNSTDSATGERATNILALAIAEVQKLGIPDTVILVDGQYEGNLNPTFDNIDDAVTAAYAVIADGASKCVIRAYANASGVPYNLDGYDYYTLRDANIFFESPFDPWKDYVTNGGTISQSDLLYDVPQDELSISIEA